MGFIRHQVANKVPDRSNLMTSLYYPYVYASPGSGGGGAPIGGIDSYTKLMLHMDGDELSTTFTDSALTPKTVTSNGNARIQQQGTGKTITANGNAQISTAQSKFGSSSGLFDGTGDYLSLSSVTDFAWMHKANAKWTISTWVKLNNFSSAHCLFDTGNATSTNIGIFAGIGTDRKINFQMYYGVSGQYIIANNAIAGEYPNDSNWHHVEISCDLTLANSNLKVFVDGSLVRTENKTANTPSSSNNSYCTIAGLSAGQSLNGYVDEFCITDNVRNTSAFTPPTSQYVPDANTKLLLHFEGSNGSTLFLDDSENIRPKFGTGMAYFDGVGDYLTLPDSDDWHFTGDLTIDFWLYPTANSSGNRMLFGQAADSFCPIELWWQTDRVIKTYLSFNNTSWVGGTHVIASTAIDLNAWTHVALVRNSSQFTFYLNGVQSGLTYTSTSPFTNSTNLLHIAYDTYKGYMDEFRLSNGIARFTSNFTPSTGAYST